MNTQTTKPVVPDDNEFKDFANTMMSASMAIGRPRQPMEDLEHTDINGTPYVVVPVGYAVHDLERLLPAPVRKRGSVSMTDVGSFVSYVRKHGDADQTVIYAAIDSEAGNCLLVAVLNDHDDGTLPGWRDHRCTYTPKRAVEWNRWTGKNKAVMSQADFATWLEDNLGDVVSTPNMPSGQDMLQMSLGFEANADKRLKSRINLQSGGTRFEFIDDETKDTRTSMQVFERFTIGIPVFDGSANAYPVEARLKYREKDGRVTFWYELIRPDRVFKTAVANELETIKADTGFMLLSGKPE